MGNEAWEKAVEAGARAASPHAFNDEFWLSRKAPDHHQRHARENARNHAVAVLRAAFPILAEELAASFEQDALQNEAMSFETEIMANRQFWRVSAHQNRSVAEQLRARIEQMKEQS